MKTLRPLVHLMFLPLLAIVLGSAAKADVVTSTTNWTAGGSATGSTLTVSASGAWGPSILWPSLSAGGSAVAPLYIDVRNSSATLVAELQVPDPGVGNVPNGYTWYSFGAGGSVLGSYSLWSGSSTSARANWSGTWTLQVPAGTYTVSSTSGTSTYSGSAFTGSLSYSSSASISAPPPGTAPSVSVSPSSATIATGQSQTFTATTAGTPTIRLQWQFSSNRYTPSWTNISGATAGTFTVSNATTENSGLYQRVATNSVGSNAASGSLQITALNTQSVQMFANGSTSSLTVALGTTVTMQAQGSGTSYTFADSSGGTSGLPSGFPTSHASKNTITFPYTFTTAGTWTVYGHAPEGSGYAASTNDHAVTVTVLAPPTITAQPANQTVTYGQSANFSAGAGGSGPLSYQWYKGTPGSGAAISGATGTSLAISTPTVSASGSTYYVVVSNSVGGATSNPATLTVNRTPLTITPTAGQSKLYGSSDPTFTWAGSGYVLGDGPSVVSGSLARTAGEAVGFYPFNEGTLAASNYTIGFTPANFTIRQSSNGTVTISPASATVALSGTQVFTAAGGQTGNYAWSCSAGTIGGSGASITWTAPASGSSATVSVYDAGDATHAVSNTATAMVALPSGGSGQVRLVFTANNSSTYTLSEDASVIRAYLAASGGTGTYSIVGTNNGTLATWVGNGSFAWSPAPSKLASGWDYFVPGTYTASVKDTAGSVGTATLNIVAPSGGLAASPTTAAPAATIHLSVALAYSGSARLTCTSGPGNATLTVTDPGSTGHVYTDRHPGSMLWTTMYGFYTGATYPTANYNLTFSSDAAGTYVLTLATFADRNGTIPGPSYPVTVVLSSPTTQMTSLVPVASTYTASDGRTYDRLWQSGSTWNAYLGRRGLQFTATGQGASGVQAFELQAQSPSAGATYSTIATGKPSSAGGPGVSVSCTFAGLMLDTVLATDPLVPSSYAAGSPLTGVWNFRARVQDASGTWSPYTTDVPVTVALPVVVRSETLQSHPPVGPDGEWLEASDAKTYSLRLWVP